MDEHEARAMVATAQVGWFVTADPEGHPAATLLPLVWTGDSVFAHMAKANPHWRTISSGASALIICSGPDAYISPTWYAAKAEHGRVVPTWNYSAVHLTGTVQVHDDQQWLLRAVTDLTDLHESERAHPWAVSDAPERFLAGQLRGIVGLEITVTGVEAKAKLSQNRSEADRHGVIAGLASEDPTVAPGALVVAQQMAKTINQSPT